VAAESRLDSVDVLRGATIAGMIVVNDPGTWSAVYPPLLHAEWNGWTYTDTIFPFFLFIVGVSMALSFGRRRTTGTSTGALYGHLARRAAALVGLGLALNVTSALAFHSAHVRFPGVLQRIGLCALFGGAVFLAGGIRGSALAAAVLLAGYAALLGTGPLEPTANVAARVDRLVFGIHTWKPGWDPEGLLSTVPAIATTLLGAIAGERVRTAGRTRAAAELAAAGAIAFAAGLLWGRILPLNKNLWTSSYALAMSGLAALALALAIEVVDVRGWKRWAAPFVWLGRNAIAVFTLSVLGAIALIAVHVPGPGGRTRSLWSSIYRTVFDHFADPRLGSLLFALAYLAFWTLVCGVLYRRRVFIRI
jgi:predicted acyltransferase